MAPVAPAAGSLAAPDSEPRTAQMDTRPLVVDTDLGPDDLIALAWLAGQPGIDLRAVTLGGTGRATCPADLARLRAVLAALDLGEVPTGCGPSTRGPGGTPFPAEVRSAAGALYGVELSPAPAPSAPDRSAEEVIASVLHAATDPISFLALGPLTTIARAVADPGDAVRVASVTASLGALDGPGDVVPAGGSGPGPAEWNAHADPGAVVSVLRSGVPLVLVTQDVADSIGPSQTLLDALAAGGDAPGARLVASLLAAAPDLAQQGWTPRDALAAVMLTAPQVAETRGRMITVTAAGADAGTIAASGGGLPAQVTVSADRAAFEQELLAGLRGEGARALASPAGLVIITGGPDGCRLETGGTVGAGRALVEARSTDGPLVAVLAALAEGHDIDELRSVLGALDPAVDPPPWLLLAAYLEVDAGGIGQSDAELAPGDHVAICITGEADTPSYQVAPEVLTIHG